MPIKHKKPWVLGLTGPSGSGKSTVCSLLRDAKYSKGALRFIDADLISRQVVEPGFPCLDNLVCTFGKEILLPNGTLDRRKLGNMVFGNPEQIEKLNQTILPYILAEIQNRINAYALEDGVKGIILDAPTLFESGADKMCSCTASILAPRGIRVQRICARDGISEEAAIKRIDSQHTDDYYKRRSDFVLVNGTRKDNLKMEVQRMAFWLGLLPAQDFRSSPRRRRKFSDIKRG